MFALFCVEAAYAYAVDKDSRLALRTHCSELLVQATLAMAHDRRPVSGRQGLEARNQQAARDALRRRQKAKKAKTVKRHVHYKEKKKLLEDLEANKPAALIVADELSRPWDNDSSDERPKKTIPMRRSQKEQVDGSGGGNAEAVSNENEDAEEEDEIEAVKEAVPDARAEGAPVEGGKKEKKKYLPFTKQMKQAEKARKEREQKEKERVQSIKVREGMLKKSKKDRRDRVS